MAWRGPATGAPATAPEDGYKWVALLAGPFHDGLVVVFSVAALLSVLGALASLLRGGRYVPRS